MIDKSAVLIRIVDDDEALADAFRFLLLSRGWHAETYANAAEFFAEDNPKEPGCIVLDYQMPNMNGIEMQKALTEAGYTCPIIFFTAHADLEMAIRALKQGACDLLRKPVQPDAFIEAVESAVERDWSARHGAEADLSPQMRWDSLSKREKQIVELVAHGLLNSLIAERLNISERTVEAHRASAYKRLGVKNSEELTTLMSTIKTPQ